MDFFTVPTLTFGVLYCFFVIGHDRRKIVHYNVTRQPIAFWIVLQLREAWGFEQPHRFLIFDRDAKFSVEVISTVKQNCMEPIRTAFRSPWQNGIAERWVGTVRRDLLDHLIVLNRRHLRRLLKEYIRYYHEDRTHLGPGKDTPHRESSVPLQYRVVVVSSRRAWRTAPPLRPRRLTSAASSEVPASLIYVCAQSRWRLLHDKTER